MVTTGTVDEGINIWKSQELPIARALFMKWIDPRRIVTVREDCEICVIILDNREQRTFPMGPPTRFVDKCHGDALVLQSLDNMLIKVITTADPLAELEIRPGPPLEIACCACAKSALAAAFTT
jgi:hypothetical protein